MCGISYIDKLNVVIGEVERHTWVFAVIWNNAVLLHMYFSDGKNTRLYFVFAHQHTRFFFVCFVLFGKNCFTPWTLLKNVHKSVTNNMNFVRNI